MPTPPLPALSDSQARHAAVNGDWTDGVFYPSSDGLPMADNQAQSEGMADCLFVLRNRHPDAFVAINLLLYYRRGHPGVRLAPDVILAFDVPAPQRWRSSYRIWEEGKPPDWVLEIASDGTVGRDKGEKKEEYAEMGVREYWLFDAQGTVFAAGEPRLQGYALAAGQYDPLPKRQEQGTEVIKSCVLGLDLLVENDMIRFRDPATGAKLRRSREEVAVRRTAESRVREEVAARRTAEARVAELEALVRGLRGESQ